MRSIVVHLMNFMKVLQCNIQRYPFRHLKPVYKHNAIKEAMCECASSFAYLFLSVVCVCVCNSHSFFETKTTT